MEPDCYLVEVLHYLNPHLIWVRNRSNDTLEQVGVYGVIPLDRELQLDTEDIETRVSNIWMQASNYIMMKVFMEATAVSFEPTYIHRRSSIFDTNIHKYGELLIEKKDGLRRKLSSYLTKSKWALYDEAAFHQQLGSGHLQTKLSKLETDEVMKIITSKLKDDESVVSFNKQTTVYQAAKKLEALTAENLNKHNRKLNRAVTNQDIVNVLDKKFRDLQLCKDVDDEGQGRAVKRNKIRSSDSGLLERLRKISAKNKNNTDCDDYEGSNIKNSDTQKASLSTDNYGIDNYGVAEKEFQNFVEREENTNFLTKKNTRNKKPRTPKEKLPEFDVKTHMRIAFSPPGVDKSKLVPKVVPIKQVEALVSNKVVEDDDSATIDSKEDMFAEVDSAVNITFTNMQVLSKHNDSKNRSEKLSNEYKREIVEESNEVEASRESDVSSSGSALNSKLLKKRLKLRAEMLKKDGGSSSSTTSYMDTMEKEETSNSSSDAKSRTGRLKEGADSSSPNTKSGTETLKKGVRSSSCNTTSELDSDDDDVSELIEKYTAEMAANVENTQKKYDCEVDLLVKKNFVNPFQNVDPNLSVFVDKLVKPVLMVHTKNNSRIEPMLAISEVPFNIQVHNVLRNMSVERPMTMQSVSWGSILRGYSTFLIGPLGCGKTMGYLPSICRLVSDFDNDIVNSVGPTCIIVGATAQSVSDIYHKCRMLLGTRERIFYCYAGMDLVKIVTSLLNGCELFICTPCVLVRLLLQTDFSLDLRRLTTFVLDDCERLQEVYKSEIKVAFSKIKNMLKTRVNREVKVQYIVASRVWCDFMEPLAKKAPNTVICIGAFQECVLYAKAHTTVDFVKPENKVVKVLDFLDTVDKTKKTVIVSRSDEEVNHLEKVLKKRYSVVFACNSDMTIEDLRSFNIAWNEYAEPTCGPILVCCDGNLNHMNITDAHYLVHFSMPELFSRFCKRFSVLNDYYPSVFKDQNESVAIKIILEDNNAEQLPKICNFIKRCTKEFPENLDGICKEILTQKDLVKASKLVPICSNLLAIGECPDFWYCKERHTFSQVHDEPKEWMPTDGVVTFRVLHYQTAVTYSARLLSNMKKDGTRKYPQTYSTLSFKMGTYYSQDCNKKLLGVPKIGDVCAVSVNQDFFVRCQVVEIINRYRTGLPNHVLIKLIDEEKFETSRDIYLYHLPDEFKEVETYVVRVNLAGVLPKDKDITFSELAKDQVQKAAENNESLYMRGKVVLTVGNRIFVDNIDVCQDLTSLNEIVVKNNFKEILTPHSEIFPDHIKKLKNRLFSDEEKTTDNTDFEQVEEVKPVKEPPKVQWAHLNREDLSLIYFTSALDPGTFFVRLAKFADTMASLCKDIDKYIETNTEPLIEVTEKDIVLAKFPDSQSYERARVDVVGSTRAKCFFVDYGDWRDIPLKHLIEIPDKFVLRLPFQAIECRLVGIQPVGDDWTDFSTNWLCDRCDVEDGDDLKGLYVQYYSTDKAKYTGGNKYAVALIDTNGDTNIVYNQQMIDLNLAAPDDDEIDILDKIDFTKYDNRKKMDESNDEENWSITDIDKSTKSCSNQPIRAMPLIADDDDSDSDRWSFNMPNDFMNDVKGNNTSNAKMLEMPKTRSNDSSVSSTKIDNESTSEYEMIKKLDIKELDSDDLSSAGSLTEKSALIKKINESRRPKLLWRQNKTTVTVKIMLIGAENYELVINERCIDFSTHVHETPYTFKINLYSLVDKNKSTHSYKGQYILVTLLKVMPNNWLTLTKESSVFKWIVYDHDSIDTSSDEEEAGENNMAEIMKSYHEGSDSDAEFCDDVNYRYPS